MCGFFWDWAGSKKLQKVWKFKRGSWETDRYKSRPISQREAPGKLARHFFFEAVVSDQWLVVRETALLGAQLSSGEFSVCGSQFSDDRILTGRRKCWHKRNFLLEIREEDALRGLGKSASRYGVLRLVLSCHAPSHSLRMTMIKNSANGVFTSYESLSKYFS
jgi:hypothetical protein